MKVVGLLVPAVLAAGCTHVHQHPPDRLSPGQRVTVRTRGGADVSSRAEIEGGVVVWRSPDGALIPASEIVSYETTSHGRGALNGGLIGLGVGAAFGVAAGFAAGSDSCEGEEGFCLDLFSPAEGALIMGVTMGLVGGLVGLAIGGIAGATDRYEVGAGAQGLRWSF